jgi:hypothetical protein
MRSLTRATTTAVFPLAAAWELRLSGNFATKFKQHRFLQRGC